VCCAARGLVASNTRVNFTGKLIRVVSVLERVLVLVGSRYLRAAWQQCRGDSQPFVDGCRVETSNSMVDYRASHRADPGGWARCVDRVGWDRIPLLSFAAAGELL
jgi:hypothetical protein